MLGFVRVTVLAKFYFRVFRGRHKMTMALLPSQQQDFTLERWSARNDNSRNISSEAPGRRR